MVTGNFSVAVDFGGGPLTSSGSLDVFLAKLSPMGNHLWSRSFGSNSVDATYGIATDAVGNVTTVGYLQGTATFGGATLSSAGLSDILVAKYSGAGAPLWAKTFGGSGDEMAYAVTVTSSGNSIVAGYFRGTATFGSTTVTSAGAADGFHSKLAKKALRERVVERITDASQ